MRLSQLGLVASIALGLNLAALALLPRAAAQSTQDPFGRTIQFRIAPANQLLLTPSTPKTAAADQFAEANQLLGQGVQQLKTSQYREAIQSWQQALEICRSSTMRQTYPQESRSGEASALINLGEAYRALSQYQRAIEYAQQASPIFRDTDDRNSEAGVLMNLGNTYSALSQYQ